LSAWFEKYREKQGRLIDGLTIAMLFTLALMGFALGWMEVGEFREFKQYQAQLAQLRVEQTADRIEHYVERLQQDLGLFIDAHAVLIGTLAQDPDQEPVKAWLGQRLERYFTDITAFRVFAPQHRPEQAVNGEVPAASTGIWLDPEAQTLGLQQPLDAAGWPEGRLAITLSLDSLNRLLGSIPVAGHRLELVQVANGVLMSIDETGASDGDTVADVRSVPLYGRLIRGTGWRLEDMPEYDLFRKKLLQLVQQFLIIGVAFLSLFLPLLHRLRRNQRNLEESHSRFQALAESASDWFWKTDLQHRLSFVSPRLEELIPIRREDLLGHRFWEIGCCHEEREIDTNLEEWMRNHRSFNDYRLTLEGPEGKQMHVRLSGKPVQDAQGRMIGYWGTGTDVTEMVEAERRAIRAEQQLRGILENLPGVVFRCVLTVDGRLQYPYISASTHEILGYTTAELETDPTVLFRATHMDDTNRFYDAIQRSAIELTPLVIEYRIIGKGGNYLWVREMAKPQRRSNGDVVFDGIILDISERKIMEEKIHLHSTILESVANGVVITDPDGIITWVNHAFTELTGYALEEVVGKDQNILSSGKQDRAFYQKMWDTIKRGKVWSGELINRRKDGTLYTEALTITPVTNDFGVVQHFVAVKSDISERKLLESQLSQAQKLESIGQLAAGIAHEINTPSQYVGDNTRFLQEAFEDISRLLTQYDQLREMARRGETDDALLSRIDSLVDEIDPAYLAEEIPTAIDQSLQGLAQIRRIVGAMKEFSHPGSDQIESVDINRLLESTITVARNEWKYVAEVETDLDPRLEPVAGIHQVLGQVFLNIIVNAAHAIADTMKEGSQEKGRITIHTRQLVGRAEIRITDTGTGIPEEIRNRIFDPFFTTKEVGKGTGQGLSIVWSAVVDKHKGCIEVESEEGKGTTFILQLPQDDKTCKQRDV